MKIMILPEKFPDPWLYDTAAILADLDSIRELILRIPLTKESFAPTNVAVAAVWELRDRLPIPGRPPRGTPTKLGQGTRPLTPPKNARMRKLASTKGAATA